MFQINSEKMKKYTTIAFITIITLFSGVIKAQNFYVNGGIGYGFALAPMSVSVNYSSANVESVSGSCGKGLIPDLGVGYSFNEHVSAEIDINYLIGHKISFSNVYSLGTPKDMETLKGEMLRIIPALKLTVGENIKPYLRFGFIVGAYNRLYDESTFYNPTYAGYDTYHSLNVYKGGSSFGFSGALGFDFHLTDNFGMYVELNTMSQAWAPKKSITTLYEINGHNKLSTLDQKDIETDFVDSYNPNTTIPQSQPNKALKVHLPFSSWGINIGIHITIPRKAKK